MDFSEGAVFPVGGLVPAVRAVLLGRPWTYYTQAGGLLRLPGVTFCISCVVLEPPR